MKQAEDNMTIDLLGQARPRGRPVKQGARTAAQRKADERARKKEQGIESVTVELSADLVAALARAVKFKDETRSQAVERILRNQLLRKR